MKLSSKIEGLLFWKGEPVSVNFLMKVFDVQENEVMDALLELENDLKERGIVMLRKNEEVTLGTNHELSELIENMRKEELMKDLSKASMETISIILYSNGSTRSEIDYIRGVNSSFILRNLMVRGLVEKVPHKDDQRKLVYRPTFDLLTYMGIARVEDAPEFEKVNKMMNESISVNNNITSSEL